MEWKNVTQHLRELNDCSIPNSQTSIIWDSSDDETASSSKRKKLSFVPSTKSFASSKDPQNNQRNHKFQVDDYNKTNIVGPIQENSKSPVFKLKVQNQYSISFNSCIIKRNVSLPPKQQNQKQISCQNLSPILRSRMKVNCNMESIDEKCELQGKLDCRKSLIYEEDSLLKENSEISRNSGISIHTQNIGMKCNDAQSFSIRSLYPSTGDSFQHVEILDVAISECGSPKNNTSQEKEIGSLDSPTIESKQTNTPLDVAEQKGSKWLKALHCKTPEKMMYQEDREDISLTKFIDSSRKKVKRNGLADQLRKYVHSWQSNSFMWDHQVSLHPPSPCSNSPPSSPLFTLEDSNGPKETETKIACADFQCKDLISETLISAENDKTPNSKATCIRKLQSSLEIASLSDSMSDQSHSSSFALPKKHFCIEVLKIEWQTPLMIAAFCQNVDECLQRIQDKTSLLTSSVFLGIFGYLDVKSLHRFETGDRIKIFAPWQILEANTFSYPVLFSSYFNRINKKSETFKFKFEQRKVTRLASWKCSCTSNHVLPFACSGGNLQICLPDLDLPKQNLLKSSRTFWDINEASKLPLSKDKYYWTVLEAIEVSNGKFDFPVSVTFKVWRIYSMRKSNSECDPTYFWILGQDPSGVFLIIEVPNRPKITSLSSLISEGVGTTHTLTHLSSVERITDSEYPLLFSLIHSLEKVHRQSVKNSPLLLVHLQDQLKKPLNSFCYKFSVLLGETQDLFVTGHDGRNLKLPFWNLDEALKQDCGSRGCIPVYILYYIHPHLYTICTHAMFPCLHKLVVKESVWFPPWMKCDGTIMLSCIIEDITVWNGCLIIDEFTQIQREKKEITIFFEDILSIVPKIDINCALYDLVSVKGCIENVNEDEACSWDICNICASCDLYRITTENMKCQKCKTENISVITKYSLEVILRPATHPNSLRLKIKLFQNTIKKLLKGIQSCQNQYKMDEILGLTVGPLICVIKAKEKCFLQTFLLTELPY